MRHVVGDGRREDDRDGEPRQAQTAVLGGVVRLAHGHVPIGGDQYRQTDRRRLSNEYQWVSVQTDVVPGDGTVSPLFGVDELQKVVDGELDQPDDLQVTLHVVAMLETGRL